MIHAHMLYGYSPIQTLKNVICYLIPVNTKHLYNICRMLDQRRRRWADVVQMLYKCFVFAGMHNYCFITYVKKAMFLVMSVGWFVSGQGIIHLILMRIRTTIRIHNPHLFQYVCLEPWNNPLTFVKTYHYIIRFVLPRHSKPGMEIYC